MDDENRMKGAPSHIPNVAHVAHSVVRMFADAAGLPGGITPLGGPVLPRGTRSPGARPCRQPSFSI